MEWTVHQGDERRLFWLAPEPPTAAPTVTLRRGNSAWAPAVSGGASVGVDAIATDCRTLTLAGQADDFGFGDRGDSWIIVSDEGGAVDFVECRVAGPAREVAGEWVAVLAERLRSLPATTSLALQHGWYSWLVAADEAASVTGRVAVEIEYSTIGAGATSTRRLDGVLHVVERDFDTGLTVPLLLSRLGHDALQVERESFQSHIDGGREDLLEWLYALRGPQHAGVLRDPVRLRPIHELLVSARLAHRDGRGEDEQRYQDRAWQRFRRLVDALQDDADNDGVADGPGGAGDFGGGGFGPRLANWRSA